MEIAIRIICLIVGYLFGLIETGYLYGKAKGVDIREHGSGNVGTTNTLRTLGKRAGAIVLVGDMLKTFIPVLLAWAICHQFFPELDYIVRLYTAAGVILGHDFPFYLKFKGGKGIACSGAMILSFYWGIIPAEVVIFFGIYFLTKYVSLASIFMYLGFFLQVIIFGQAGIFGMSQGMLVEVYILIFVLTIIAINCHRDNIKRLLKGEERRTYLRKNKNEIIGETQSPVSTDEKVIKNEEEEQFEEPVTSVISEEAKENEANEQGIEEEKEEPKIRTILPTVEEITAERLQEILPPKVIPAQTDDEDDDIELAYEAQEEKIEKKRKKNKNKK